eukprot:603286-Rhodomonas_salina.1
MLALEINPRISHLPTRRDDEAVKNLAVVNMPSSNLSSRKKALLKQEKKEKKKTLAASTNLRDLPNVKFDAAAAGMTANGSSLRQLPPGSSSAEASNLQKQGVDKNMRPPAPEPESRVLLMCSEVIYNGTPPPPGLPTGLKQPFEERWALLKTLEKCGILTEVCLSVGRYQHVLLPQTLHFTMKMNTKDCPIFSQALENGWFDNKTSRLVHLPKDSPAVSAGQFDRVFVFFTSQEFKDNGGNDRVQEVMRWWAPYIADDHKTSYTMALQKHTCINAVFDQIVVEEEPT